MLKVSNDFILIKPFVDGKQDGSIPLKLEQRSDSLIVFMLNIFEPDLEDIPELERPGE
jgi:hypothetical protein|tara:strand:+ start:1750 stop:1923 length:174 start_codon:yes stop_codon:yes gene_type:complete